MERIGGNRAQAYVSYVRKMLDDNSTIPNIRIATTPPCISYFSFTPTVFIEIHSKPLSATSMPSLIPLFHFVATATALCLAFLSFSIAISTILILILYHTIKDSIMLSVGTCTRMIAKFLGFTFTIPAPRMSLPPFDASIATIPKLRRLLATGTVSSAFLIEIYLEKISRHPSTIFTFPKAELMAQARICDDMRAEGKIVRPLGGIPVLVAVETATYELMEPSLERAGEGVERPFVAGSVLILGFLNENVLGELVKWERLQEGTTVIETCVVEGLAVVVRDVEGDFWSCVHGYRANEAWIG